MDILIVVIVCIICLFAGYAIGRKNNKASSIDGTIIIDYMDGLNSKPTVYCSLPKDPSELTGDEVLTMNVYIAAPDILSQQKQES